MILITIATLIALAMGMASFIGMRIILRDYSAFRHPTFPAVVLTAIAFIVMLNAGGIIATLLALPFLAAAPAALGLLGLASTRRLKLPTWLNRYLANIRSHYQKEDHENSRPP